MHRVQKRVPRTGNLQWTLQKSARWPVLRVYSVWQTLLKFGKTPSKVWWSSYLIFETNLPLSRSTYLSIVAFCPTIVPLALKSSSESICKLSGGIRWAFTWPRGISFRFARHLLTHNIQFSEKIHGYRETEDLRAFITKSYRKPTTEEDKRGEKVRKSASDLKISELWQAYH